MAKQVLSDLNFNSQARITNLLDAVSAQEPVTLTQLNSAVEGLAWKDSCRVAAASNINVASPGATVDGVSMAANDRMLLRGQTTAAENGIYLWTGAATPATRAADCSTAAELEQAVTTVEEGTSAGTTWRQTLVNFTLGSGSIAWVAFGTGASAASEASAGVAEVATQAETDAGTDDVRMVTPLKLATYVGRIRKVSASVGDGSATQYTVTHNLNTLDVQVAVYRNSGALDEVLCDVEHATVNTVVVRFASAPTANLFRVVVLG